ncbi:hypothetical protein JW960_15755 [candidate division KSB1 bacterium]|nr:hypothetical protein [candidate division KSB1 bacterium]
MNDKQNCWEFKKCGREPGGNKEKELGVCPTAIDEKNDGINHGINGGRFCWTIVGTLCDGKLFGSFISQQVSCMECEFLKTVVQEEGDDLKLS